MGQIIRKLDGYFFRIKRDEKWINLCFTDMTRGEMLDVIEGRSDEWLNSLYNGLLKLLQEIGAMVNNVHLDIIIEETIQVGTRKTPRDKVIDIHTVIRNLADYYDINSDK